MIGLTREIYKNHVAENLQFKVSIPLVQNTQRVIGVSSLATFLGSSAIHVKATNVDETMSLEKIVDSEDVYHLLPWREKIVNTINQLLKGDRLFKEIIKEGFESSSEGELNIGAPLTPLDKEELSDPKNLDLEHLCNQSKELSIAFQNFLEESTQEYIEEVAELMVPLYEKLIYSKFGSYVLKKMIQISQVTDSRLASYCRKNFEDLVLNEFTSRVMQQLIELNQDFRQFSLWFFENNFDFCLTKITAVLLIIACIKSCQKPSQYAFVIKSLKQNPTLMSLRMFQRVLYAFTQSTSQKYLAELSRLLDFDKHYKQYFNDKFTVYIIYELIARGANSTTNAILRLINSKCERLIGSRFFKLLLLKLHMFKQSESSKIVIAHVAAKILTVDLSVVCQHQKDILIFLMVSASDPFFADASLFRELLLKVRPNAQVWAIISEKVKTTTTLSMHFESGSLFTSA